MRFPKGGKGPHGNDPRPAMDVMMMSGESVTRFYNEEVSAAQSKMLRNFLGILAQKVTDIVMICSSQKTNSTYTEKPKKRLIFSRQAAP